MKRINIILILVFFILKISSSQNFWQQLNLPVPDMSVSTAIADNNNRLFVGSFDNIYFTDDNGANWGSANNWPGYGIKCLAVNSSNDIFAGTYSEGIYRSTDGGITYVEINNGITFLNIWCIFIDANDELIIGTPGGLFKSTDNGNTWNPHGDLKDEVMAMTMDESGNLYAGTFGSGIFISTNMGTNFTPINNGIPDTSQVTALIAVPQHGVLAGFYPNGVYHTTDQGNTWVEANDGLPFKNEKDPDFLYSVDGFYLLLGMIFLVIYFMGAFFMTFTKKGAIIWIALASGLPMEPTTSCITGNSNNDLYIGTYEDGLFMNAIPVGIEKLPAGTSSFNVDNVYPNPSDGLASFNINVPEKCSINVDVFDQLGQHCMTLANKEFTKGNYRINFSTNDLQPGLYFVKVRSDHNLKTIRFLRK